MKSHRVFISHSSGDRAFAQLLVSELRQCGLALDPWIDSEQIVAGDDILEQLGTGLTTADLLVFLVSQASLSSGWVAQEIKFAASRQIKEKRIRLLPFVIDSTRIEELPWYLQNLNASHITPDSNGAAIAIQMLRHALERRVGSSKLETTEEGPLRDARIDILLQDIALGDHKAAAFAALEIIRETGKDGQNKLFETLVRYVNLPNEHELFWPALLTIEHSAELMPSLMCRDVWLQLAEHADFSVRSTAAAIGMNLAQWAPDRVPVDILFRLSRFDEDWYVEAPANAALKTMASAVPDVLTIYYLRLQSTLGEERRHAAAALLDISSKEPLLLDRGDLKAHVKRLQQAGDTKAGSSLQKALSSLPKELDTAGRYKYGI